MSGFFSNAADVQSKLNDVIIPVGGVPCYVVPYRGTDIWATPLLDRPRPPDVRQLPDTSPVVLGAKDCWIVNANSPAVDLGIPEVGYMNVFDLKPAKPKFLGLVYVSRKSTRSSHYGLHQNSINATVIGGDQALARNLFHPNYILSWGEFLAGVFPPFLEVKDRVQSGKVEAMAFSRHFALTKEIEGPTFLLHNNRRIGIVGKKVRLFPEWKKGWLEKLLRPHV